MGRVIQSLVVGWQIVRASDGQAYYVLQNDHLKIADDWSLSISDIDITDAGQYMCMVSGVYQSKFQVDVLLRERRKVVKETEKVKLLPSQFFPGNNMELVSVWSGWSECNHCGKIGQRHKIGLCTVRKIDYRHPITPVDVPMMDSFIDGIPCHSALLPSKVARKKSIRTRPTEVMIGACHMPCPTVQPFITVTDENGGVVEVVEAGFYSVKDKPKLPPMVKRKVRYEDSGKHLVLLCPRKESGGLIRWQNATRVINPMTIRRQTRGRISIDSQSRLHIRKLRRADQAHEASRPGYSTISSTDPVVFANKRDTILKHQQPQMRL
ncbi:hypothetical protein ScPMuIL_004376 [Solemya velum]